MCGDSLDLGRLAEYGSDVKASHQIGRIELNGWGCGEDKQNGDSIMRLAVRPVLLLKELPPVIYPTRPDPECENKHEGPSYRII